MTGNASVPSTRAPACPRSWRAGGWHSRKAARRPAGPGDAYPQPESDLRHLRALSTIAPSPGKGRHDRRSTDIRAPGQRPALLRLGNARRRLAHDVRERPGTVPHLQRLPPPNLRGPGDLADLGVERLRVRDPCCRVRAASHRAAGRPSRRAQGAHRGRGRARSRRRGIRRGERIRAADARVRGAAVLRTGFTDALRGQPHVAVVRPQARTRPQPDHARLLGERGRAPAARAMVERCPRLADGLGGDGGGDLAPAAAARPAARLRPARVAAAASRRSGPGRRDTEPGSPGATPPSSA